MSVIYSKTYQHGSLRQYGVGMIEVLVTLFILSIGILGVASLQFISSFSNSDALNRSQSVMVAQQLSERLRASARMSLIGDGLVVDEKYFDNDIYNFDNLACASTASEYNCFCLSKPADIPDCAGGQCSAAEFAVYDGYEVSCSAVSSNPTVTLSVSCDDNNAVDGELCSTGSRVSIVLSWPIENWKNIDRTLNEECLSEDEPRDCVKLDVLL
ncbi:type IV pilus modification protein PilV [Aliiglaciecola sp. 3_MG-2023]|uniref:type IV pilus modification protein PilV n=1 Tax=Aliiglaciecola sp. 3_MG-2023 TaxID=3062644 RepID=UPI0026E14186|nr:type IV pilus modification protein PilV [Aliiglaciecola sp. 3_MG-2023]MDO6694029.1 type IV pilus modification protein PilV [Aliiglaciecola sp. 3_MG-2023]